MGDTPSVAWLLKGDPSDPSTGGWGGRFVRAWPRPYLKFDRPTTPEDKIEVFGILEISLAVDERDRVGAEAWLHVENQALPGHVASDGTIRFRFCPKAAKVYKFDFKSDIPELDGVTGGITAIHPTQKVVTTKSRSLPNWWTDNPAPELFEDGHMGVKTVNKWRREYLSDFADRMKRLDPSKERSGILNNE